MRTGDWIRCYDEATPDAVRMLCLPHAGGAATFFRPLSRLLAPDIETLTVQYPGRQDRRTEPAAASIGEIADAVLGELGDGAGPVALFGHSMGAVVAFEIALRLERSGQPALLLAVSGRRAPSRQPVETRHLLDGTGMLAELKRLNGTESAILDDDEVLSLVLPPLRADYRVLAAYTDPAVRLRATPILAMVGNTDPVAPLDDVLAWEEYAGAGFDARVFPGGHFYLSRQSAILVSALREALTGHAARRHDATRP